MTAASRRRLPLALVIAVVVGSPTPCAVLAAGLHVAWSPANPRAGDAVMIRVLGAPAGATLDAVLDGHPIALFPSAGGHAGIVGIDMDAAPAIRRWQVTARTTGTTQVGRGEFPVVARSYQVQHLTVPPSMVELDPVTERRALAEGERLRTTYRTISGERLWRGHWMRPVLGDEPGTGFGARRVINGQPRTPHSGIDFPAPVGTPVVAANRGRVALVGEFFFPGRLVILDHGLGLHTVYFHLDTIAVTDGQIVERGQMLGTVGLTGRVTGPHLHFGAQVGAARIDPAGLLALSPDD